MKNELPLAVLPRLGLRHSLLSELQNEPSWPNDKFADWVVWLDQEWGEFSGVWDEFSCSWHHKCPDSGDLKRWEGPVVTKFPTKRLREYRCQVLATGHGREVRRGSRAEALYRVRADNRYGAMEFELFPPTEHSHELNGRPYPDDAATLHPYGGGCTRFQHHGVFITSGEGPS